MDPATTVGTGLALWASKDMLGKVLGPTADYLGGGLKSAVEKCNVNLGRVFQRAAEKLGPRLEKPGAVNPRVLRHVYEDGRFAEDDVVVEYYGGLLAGSKTDTGTSDQALPYLAAVQRMSAYELRLHFVLYYELLRIHKGSGVPLSQGNRVHDLALVIPHEMFLTALGIGPEDEKAQMEYWRTMSHAVVGLHQEGLIGNYTYGKLDEKAKDFPGAPENGILLTPSFLGAELFAWAIGVESPSGHHFFDIDISTVDKAIPIVGSAFPKSKAKVD
jgi:hypothetical protein